MLKLKISFQADHCENHISKTDKVFTVYLHVKTEPVELQSWEI